MANIIRLGGGGGSIPTLITKTITENGTYNATDDNADGYSEVEVDVEGGGVGGVIMLTSNNPFVQNTGITGTDVANVARSWTFDKAGTLKFAPTTYGRTNTGTNEGFYDIQLNGVSVAKQYLTTGVDTPIAVDDIPVSVGDTLGIVYGFDNYHSRCDFTFYGAITLVIGNGSKYNLLYSLDQSQGGVWVDTDITASDYDKFVFINSDDGDEQYTVSIAVSDIAVYTGGTDVYTTILSASQIGRDFNVRIYNGKLYISFGGTGASTKVVGVYEEISGGSGENIPYLIFNNGEWLNSDVFAVVTSATGASDLSIVDGCLYYSGTTGISISPVDTTKQFVISAEFEVEAPNDYSYVQSGRCAIGADAKRCQNDGYQRYSWHDNTWTSPTSNIVYQQGNNRTGEAVFLSGNGGIKIKRIYGQISNDAKMYMS